MVKDNPFLADIEIAAPFAPRNGAWAHLTFSLGSPGTGLNFHYHEAAWNAVLRGTKRFLLSRRWPSTPRPATARR